MYNRDMLFSDEPLGSFDANSVMAFEEVISKLAEKGKT